MTTAFCDVTVPVDASVTAQRGIDFALDFARNGARLHFCSVVDTASALCGGAFGTTIDPTPMVEALEGNAQRACVNAVSAARKRGVDADARVIFGPVVPAIRRYVCERKSDALVIGTHGRTGASRVLLGSVTESLVQTSDVPVLVTHADDVANADGPITVAVDGSPAANAALSAAIALAREQRRCVSIVTVVESGRSDWARAEPILSDAADAMRASGLDFELVTLCGPVIDTILETAQRRLSPMIVIGTRGRSEAARFFLGSVATGVLERARVPVMVVRQP
jgi:nucleotide-binding universal stress UspA family protein